MISKYKYKPSGDSGIIVTVGQNISEAINREVVRFAQAIEELHSDGIKEMIPTYQSLLVIYDPLKISFDSLLLDLKSIESNIKINGMEKTEVIHIPTLYGSKYGLDLEYVSEYNQLSPKEVIALHSSEVYRVYMLGFTPGFPYLGGMNEKIATPRLEIPRMKIEAGSVGIAGNQTGVYPIESPGGWQIIGRTPLKLFDIENEPIFSIKAGQYIKFDPINEAEYEDISLAVENGSYQIKKTPYERSD